jgi:hypothetical protein
MSRVPAVTRVKTPDHAGSHDHPWPGPDDGGIVVMDVIAFGPADLLE